MTTQSLSHSVAQSQTDPRKIHDLEGYIVDLINQLDDAYLQRLESKKRYWRGLPVQAVPTIEDIQRLEQKFHDAIQEARRRRI